MPELPEVETMRRGLFPTVGGIITAVAEPDIPYRPIKIDPTIEVFRERILRRTLLPWNESQKSPCEPGSGDSIVMQPKMAGIAMVSMPPSEQHTRIVFDLRGAKAPRFLYWDRRGLGTVSLWTGAQMEEHLGPDKLGPDASIVDQKTFVDRFSTIDREVKVAMLDQRVVCGIGNLYAAEILHAAKVHPTDRCKNLSRSKWNRIHRETIRILCEAIEKEGSTLSDGTYRNAINGEGSYQNQHLVYDREDEQCLTCKKETIQRMVQAQRSTFFCPKCQGNFVKPKA